jgi:hypothetical protein
LIANSIIEAESFMPKAAITSSLEKPLQNSKSRFHSKKYTVETSNTGALEELVRLYDLEISTPTQPMQPPLEDDTAEYEDVPESHNFATLFFILVIIGGIIAWIKFPNLLIFNWIRGKISRAERGKFIPVRNEEA